MKLANERRLGATEIASVAAHYYPGLPAQLTKYGNIRDTYERIVNGIEKKRTPQMRRGLAVEPVLRSIYVERFRAQLLPLTHPTIVEHPEHAFATATPDDVTADNLLVEYKSANSWAEKGWTHTLTPDAYALQVQWLMEVCGCSSAVLFAGFGHDVRVAPGSDPGCFVFRITRTRPYPFRRDPEICALLLDAGRRFWTEHVVPRIPPDVKPINNRRAIKALYKRMAA